MDQDELNFPIYESDSSENSGEYTFTQPTDGRAPAATVVAPTGSKLVDTQFLDPNNRHRRDLLLPGEKYALTADDAKALAEDEAEGLKLG